MKSEEIRQKFLDYFKNLDHTIVPSSPVVPIDDPTLLFTNAGMNQFKDIFIGRTACPYNPPRAASVQKCIRVSGKHNDLEEVGRDGWHHTFFEMLGNWSFGDYFKKEAIVWAWELLTKHYGLPPERLWAAVHENDDESAEIWEKVVGLPLEKIVRCGDKDNFWEMADTGPCGPTTEIHYDWGEEIDPDGLPNSSERFVEVWNIVFMQYFRNPDGSLDPLPARNVDTGMGFERLVAILQGTRDNYRTDIFAPLLDKIAEMSGHDYDEGGEITVAFRVLADHIRALAFAIADGAIPGSTGRGYVLRRILRRAARFSRVLGVHEPILWKLVTPLVDKMGSVYPELVQRAQMISQVIKSEEERFGKTLDFGIELFEKIADELEAKGEKVIPGESAFLLYDTYGFPLDLTQLMARERGLEVDVEGFERLMEQQRERARSAGTFEVEHRQKGEWLQITPGEDSHKLCYETESAESEIRKVRPGEGGKIEVVLAETPFYAESGGQVGDTGTIKGENFVLRVEDTQPEGTHIIHICRVEGEDIPFERLVEIFRENPRVFAEVDHERRWAIRKNHTATHLLHSALRKVLGEHIRQAGSLVAPDRLRFDYTHYEQPSPEQLERIERLVNEVVQRDIPVETKITTYQEATKEGAMALFGEKYGEQVRMVVMGDFSKELCGGTHLSRTGEIGLFLITHEENIGSGMRRIEAVTGTKAVEYVLDLRRRWRTVEGRLSATGDSVFSKIDKLFADLEELKRIRQQLARGKASDIAEQLFASAEKIGDSRVVVAKVEVSSRDELFKIMESLEKKMPSGVILLGAVVDGGKVAFGCSITPDVIKNFGLKAGDIVREVAKIAGGGGGGRPDFAQAGGKNPEKLDEALELGRKLTSEKLRE
ncbi:alanine--tRNA ligase [bacterium]|nr:alanine--tRNA ligase [bacterium]